LSTNHASTWNRQGHQAFSALEQARRSVNRKDLAEGTVRHLGIDLLRRHYDASKDSFSKSGDFVQSSKHAAPFILMNE
jgi:hypothetical protein